MRILVYGMSGVNLGGIETFLTEMNRFMPNGTIFDYVIEGASCLYEKNIQRQSGKIYYVTRKNHSAFGNLIDNYRLLKHLKAENDAVYFNLNTLSWIEPIKIALSFGYRVYVHSHISELAVNDVFHRMLYSINKKRLSRMNIHRLTCSEKATRFMFYPKDVVEMIYNAVDLSKFQYRNEVRNSVKAELHVLDKTKIIGFVGRLDKQKNVLMLPDILKQVISGVEELKMLIIGDGPLRDELQNKIKEMGLSDNCILLGNKADAYRYYNAMDVLLLPSLYEGLPIVLIEAQTNGLKCIVSETVSEQSDITGNLRFVPTNDLDGWRDRIRESLADNYSNRAAEAVTIADTRFNIKREAMRLENILTNC